MWLHTENTAKIILISFTSLYDTFFLSFVTVNIYELEFSSFLYSMKNSVRYYSNACLSQIIHKTQYNNEYLNQLSYMTTSYLIVM